MKNHVMVCPPPQNQNEVAKPSGSWQYPPPPFLEDFGGHFHVMCAQLRPVGTTTSLGSAGDCQLDQLRPSRSIDRHCRLDWAHAELNAMIIHRATTCERGAVKRLMHLTRSDLALGWPPWWKWLRNVIFSFSDHFCLIFSWKGRHPRPYSLFHKKDITILFPTVYFFHTEWFLNSSK